MGLCNTLHAKQEPVLLWRIVLVSVVLMVGAFALFEWEQNRGAGVAEARTATVNVFVMVELLYLLSCRSLDRSALTLGFFSNPWLLAGIITMVAAQLLFTYAPFMQDVFESASIDPDVWARVLVIALAGWAIVGIDKAAAARWSARRVRATTA